MPMASSILLKCVNNALLQFQTMIIACLRGHKSLLDGLTLENNMIILMEKLRSSLAHLYDTMA